MSACCAPRLCPARHATGALLTPSLPPSLPPAPTHRATQTYARTGVVVYVYAEAATVHTTYTDGTEVYEFPNGQVRPVGREGSARSLPRRRPPTPH